MSSLPRPRFNPSPCDGVDPLTPPLVFPDGTVAIPIISCPAGFPPELFEVAISQLVHHPEYNSTLILRSETVQEYSHDFPDDAPHLQGFCRLRLVHRRLLPRRPGRDTGLEQFCTLYGDSAMDDAPPTILLLTPLATPESPLPYYHPTVEHLAFRYISADPPLVRIEVVPLPGTQLDLKSRLYRTCLALLETLHRYGWGAISNYKKRVQHDRLVPRETYQDLYLVMRERHKHLVDQWHEVTDPLKHVFEDIGIATYLMLLWKDTFEPGSSPTTNKKTVDRDRPWSNWPRPPDGFLDLGCGNGLLVHILTQEGYSGYGIDIRARTSWEHYPESTRRQLKVHSLNPTSTSAFAPYLKPGVFLIGNHADELTPWVPVLSTLCSSSGYLSIPCCPWTFDQKFDRSNTPAYPVTTNENESEQQWLESLNLGGDGSNTSSYSMYRIWLATLSAWCGWEVECDMLRIPSTRNWAIVGRKTLGKSPESNETFRQNVEGIVGNVRERGIFKTRQPEGKAGDH